MLEKGSSPSLDSLCVFAQLCVSDNSSAGQLFSWSPAEQPDLQQADSTSKSVSPRPRRRICQVPISNNSLCFFFSTVSTTKIRRKQFVLFLLSNWLKVTLLQKRFDTIKYLPDASYYRTPEKTVPHFAVLFWPALYIRIPYEMKAGKGHHVDVKFQQSFKWHFHLF